MTAPTVVLVHGAFADASSWNGVVARLVARGRRAVALANPLRGLAHDAAYVRDSLAGIEGPVVLVGHSYGGAVIGVAASGLPQVRALIYVAAFAPDVGESAGELAGRHPGGTLGAALAPPVPLGGGGQDLYILQDRFAAQFAADVPADAARLMAVTQRPIVAAALGEPAARAAWREIPSWFVHGSGDRNIPPEALGFMAARAGSRRTVVVEGASHVVMVSHPEVVAGLVEEAVEAARDPSLRSG